MNLGLGLGLPFSRVAGPSFVGPLDDYASGMTAAWDVRNRLRSDWTGALCEVRADRSGQPTFDVPFKADGTWDTAALLSFAGSDSCYVTQLYDQSGNGRHIGNIIAATQPMLVNAGSLVTDGPLFTYAGAQFLTIGSLNYLDVFGTNQFQVVSRMTNDGAPGNGRAFLMSPVLTYFPWEALGNIYFDTPDRIQIATPADILDVECVASFERFASNIANMRRNGTVVCTGASTTALSSGTAQFWYGLSFEGHLPSMVIWNTADATVAPLRAAALP
jgi:hypothetical protein